MPDDYFSKQLRGFGPIGIAAILLILAGNVLFLPLSAILVILWTVRSNTPWREIGYVRPRNWIASAATGIIFGAIFKLVMKAFVMPLFHAPPINQAYHDLAGNPAAIPSTLYALIIGAGFGEETVFRGYMFERLEKLLGSTMPAKIATVLITSALFASAHYWVQGAPGVEQAAITGLVFAAIFARTGELWMLMWAHASFDLTAYALIYWNLETTVAQWIFKSQ